MTFNDFVSIFEQLLKGMNFLGASDNKVLLNEFLYNWSS